MNNKTTILGELSQEICFPGSVLEFVGLQYIHMAALALDDLFEPRY